MQRGVSVSQIRMTFEMLNDGKWHRITELLMSLDLDEHRFQELTSFLSTYSFIKIDEKNGRVKINSDFKKLLNSTIT